MSGLSPVFHDCIVTVFIFIIIVIIVFIIIIVILIIIILLRKLSGLITEDACGLELFHGALAEVAFKISLSKHCQHENQKASSRYNLDQPQQDLDQVQMPLSLSHEQKEEGASLLAASTLILGQYWAVW